MLTSYEKRYEAVRAEVAERKSAVADRYLRIMAKDYSAEDRADMIEAIEDSAKYLAEKEAANESEFEADKASGRIAREREETKERADGWQARDARRADTQAVFGFEDSDIAQDDSGVFWRILWAGKTKRGVYSAKVVPARSNARWASSGGFSGFSGGDAPEWFSLEGDEAVKLVFAHKSGEWSRLETNRKARERRAENKAAKNS